MIEVATPENLLRAPEIDPMELRAGTPRAGIDDVASTLLAARRLPTDLTVRVVLQDETGVTRSVTDIESAFRSAASDRSAVAWREGIAQRAMGLRQLPAGLVQFRRSGSLLFAAYAFGRVSRAGARTGECRAAGSAHSGARCNGVSRTAGG